MTLQFANKWNMANNSLGHFENGDWNIFLYTFYHDLLLCILSSFVSVNMLYELRTLWLPVNQIQYDYEYVLIDAIKSSLRELRK